MLGFEIFTIPCGLYAWKAGLPFWEIMPGAILCGLTGGTFLSAGVFTIKTGYMERSSSFYRFSERPFTFIMDSICITLAVALSAAWPIGYSLQELTKLQHPTHEQSPSSLQ